MLRWGIGGCVAVLAVLAAWLPAPAAAAGEGCPKTHGGPAALDWGMNASEQLGAGFSSGLENSAQPVNGLAGATQIKAGFKFGLALLGDCTVRSWGTGNKGQLGNSLQQTETHPVAVTGLTDVKEIAVANAHAMALRYDGTVWTWGASEFGERGNKEKGFERTARQTEPSVFVRPRPAHPGARPEKRQADRGRRHARLRAARKRRGDGLGRRPERRPRRRREPRRRRTVLRRNPRHHADPVQHRARAR